MCTQTWVPRRGVTVLQHEPARVPVLGRRPSAAHRARRIERAHTRCRCRASVDHGIPPMEMQSIRVARRCKLRVSEAREQVHSVAAEAALIAGRPIPISCHDHGRGRTLKLPMPCLLPCNSIYFGPTALMMCGPWTRAIPFLLTPIQGPTISFNVSRSALSRSAGRGGA